MEKPSFSLFFGRDTGIEDCFDLLLRLITHDPITFTNKRQGIFWGSFFYSKVFSFEFKEQKTSLFCCNPLKSIRVQGTPHAFPEIG